MSNEESSEIKLEVCSLWLEKEDLKWMDTTTDITTGGGGGVKTKKKINLCKKLSKKINL